MCRQDARNTQSKEDGKLDHKFATLGARAPNNPHVSIGALGYPFLERCDMPVPFWPSHAVPHPLDECQYLAKMKLMLVVTCLAVLVYLGQR